MKPSPLLATVVLILGFSMFASLCCLTQAEDNHTTEPIYYYSDLINQVLIHTKNLCGYDQVVMLVDVDDAEFIPLADQITTIVESMKIPMVYFMTKKELPLSTSISTQTTSAPSNRRSVVLMNDSNVAIGKTAECYVNENLTIESQNFVEYVFHKELTGFPKKSLFILMTKNSADVLIQIEKCFTEHLKARGSLFPHRSRWLIISNSYNSDLLLDSIIHQQHTSLLDNVAIIVLRRQNNSKSFTLKSHTFMWRDGRTRDKQEVQLERLSVKSNMKCIMFPNIHFGCNGRAVTITEHIKPNGTVDIGETTRMLFFPFGNFMNLTYKYLNVDRSEAPYVLGVKVDILGSARLYQDGYNISYSFPVIFDKYIGVYKHQKPTPDKSMLIMFPFVPKHALFMIPLSFLYCIILYIIIAILSPQNIGVDFSDDLEQPEINENTTDDRKLNYDENNTEKNDIFTYHCTTLIGNKTNNEKQKKINSPNTYLVCLQVSISLFLCLIGQSTSPKPRQMSSRIVLFFLLFSTVIYYALYTGLLAADITTTTNTRVINSWREVIDNKYKCTVLWEKKFISNLLTRSEIAVTDIQKELGNYCGEYNMTEIEVGHIEGILMNQRENEILIYIESEIIAALNNMNKPNMFGFIRQHIFDLNLAFAFPYGSEIGHSLSSYLIRGHEAGFNFHGLVSDNINSSHNLILHKQTVTTESYDKYQMGLKDFKYLCMTSLGLLTMSVILLISEIIFINLKSDPK